MRVTNRRKPKLSNPFYHSRRLARVVALIALFSLEFSEAKLNEAKEALSDALTGSDRDINGPLYDILEEDDAISREGESYPVDMNLASSLLFGVLELKPEIDGVLTSFAVDWSLARIGRLEKSILRIAVYELLRREDIPPAVTLDEAVELAKAFCTREAAVFINGILGNIHNHLQELKKLPVEDA